jgi:hypothetical protein
MRLNGWWTVVLMLGCTEKSGEIEPAGDGSPTMPMDSGTTDAGGDDSTGETSGDTGTDDSADGDGGDGSGGDDGGTGGEDTGGEEEPPPPALPVEGAWSLGDWTLASDDCGVASYQDPSEFVADAYTVAHVDSTTFSLASGGEPPGNCVVAEDLSYECESATVRQDLSDFGFDAEMVVDTTFRGVLSSDYTTLSGTTDVTVTCEGSCWLIELVLDFPCPMAIDMSLLSDE